MFALLPTNNPAPMMPPIEISATCRGRKVRTSVGAAGEEADIVGVSLRKCRDVM
jgi:hypothetical protein